MLVPYSFQMNKHLNVTIKGKVQGVWYRAYAQKKAVELNIAGFVCNQPDGSVYAELEGSEDALEAMIAWCKKGPPLASVKEILVKEGPWINMDSFNIKR